MSDIKEIRLCRPGDEIGITRLFQDIFGREMSLKEWQWKYPGRTNKRFYSSVAVNDSEEIVAHYGGMTPRMIYNSREMTALSIGDVMVHPKYRSLKLFKKMAVLTPDEASKDGIIFGYGFPTERAFLLPLKLNLYEKLEDVSEATKPVGFHNNANRLMFKLFPLGFDDDRIDALWESVSRELTLAVIRDRAYLTWRYQTPPLFSYEIWGLKRRWSGRLEGLAVLRGDGERMLLIDFVCPGYLLSTLFQKIENYAHTAGKRMLVLWCPEYLKQQMTQIGFSIQPAGTTIPLSTHEGWLRKEDIGGKFFYAMGDTDFL